MSARQVVEAPATALAELAIKEFQQNASHLSLSNQPGGAKSYPPRSSSRLSNDSGGGGGCAESSLPVEPKTAAPPPSLPPSSISNDATYAKPQQQSQQQKPVAVNQTTPHTQFVPVHTPFGVVTSSSLSHQSTPTQPQVMYTPTPPTSKNLMALAPNPITPSTSSSPTLTNFRPVNNSGESPPPGGSSWAPPYNGPRRKSNEAPAPSSSLWYQSNAPRRKSNETPQPASLGMNYKGAPGGGARMSYQPPSNCGTGSVGAPVHQVHPQYPYQPAPPPPPMMAYQHAPPPLPQRTPPPQSFGGPYPPPAPLGPPLPKPSSPPTTTDPPKSKPSSNSSTNLYIPTPTPTSFAASSQPLPSPRSSNVKSFFTETSKSILANFQRKPHHPSSDHHNDPDHVDDPGASWDYIANVPLETSVSRAGRFGVPDIMIACVEYVEAQNGLKTEGVYRVPGSAKRVREWMDRFESAAKEGKSLVGCVEKEGGFKAASAVVPPPTVGPVVELRGESVHTAVSLLKKFFSRLPGGGLVDTQIWVDLDGLLNDSLTNKDPPATTNQKIRSFLTIRLQTKSHLHTIAYFFAHLHRIHQNASVNLMASKNLQIVLFPTPEGKGRGIEWLIEEFWGVFPDACVLVPIIKPFQPPAIEPSQVGSASSGGGGAGSSSPLVSQEMSNGMYAMQQQVDIQQPMHQGVHNGSPAPPQQLQQQSNAIVGLGICNPNIPAPPLAAPTSPITDPSIFLPAPPTASQTQVYAAPLHQYQQQQLYQQQQQGHSPQTQMQ
ncbi:Beta-chimaerin [Chytridiales sp. JEL 0842]|nr:Beta-chimaerin [Chytridiales sp. JEL 0842]